MYTVIIATDSYKSNPAMFQYSNLQTAKQMATLGYKETVHIFDDCNGFVCTYIDGVQQEVA